MSWLWVVGGGTLLAWVGIFLAISAALQRRNHFWATTQAVGPVVYWSGGTVVIEGCELVIRGWWSVQRWPLASTNVAYVDGVDGRLSVTVLRGDRHRGMHNCRPAEAVYELVGCALRQRQPG